MITGAQKTDNAKRAENTPQPITNPSADKASYQEAARPQDSIQRVKQELAALDTRIKEATVEREELNDWGFNFFLYVTPIGWLALALRGTLSMFDAPAWPLSPTESFDRGIIEPLRQRRAEAEKELAALQQRQEASAILTGQSERSPTTAVTPPPPTP